MIGNINNLEGKKLDNPALKNALMKVLVSPEEGWDGYVMRVLELGKDGYSPKHSHPWPHINFFIEGEGELLYEGEYKPVTAGGYAFVKGGMEHQFRNTGDKVFKFICIVPEEGHLG